jgi:hypothetical protein
VHPSSDGWSADVRFVPDLRGCRSRVTATASSHAGQRPYATEDGSLASASTQGAANSPAVQYAEALPKPAASCCNVNERPFMTCPTACVQRPGTGDSRQENEGLDVARTDDGEVTAVDGCDLVDV